MNRAAIVGAIMFLSLIFALASQAIVKIKTAELSFQLSRSQLFNYELSSKMLRSRFRTMLEERESYSKEIKLNVLESGVLNFKKSEQFVLGIYDQIGLGLVNAVRIITLKPYMALQENQTQLLTLQYAFFMERSRNFSDAVKQYEKLEPSLHAVPQDHGFVLLHMGYCYALLGRTEDALKRLREIQEIHPGTRSAEDAAVLEQILLEGKLREEKITKQYANKVDQAKAFYKIGQYATALKRYNQADSLTTEHQFYRARSLEGVGKKKEAVASYFKLVNQKKDSNIALKANRRLMMIGTFYGGGKALKKRARINAVKMGDTKALEEVKKGEEVALKPRVIEKIKERARQANQEGNEGADLAMLEKLRALNEDLKKAELLQDSIDTQVQKVKPIEIKRKIRRPRIVIRPAMVVEFGGRKIYGTSLELNGHSLIIDNGGMKIALPYVMLQSVHAIARGPEAAIKKARTALKLQLKGGTYKTVPSLQHKGGMLYFGKDQGQISDQKLTKIVPVLVK